MKFNQVKPATKLSPAVNSVLDLFSTGAHHTKISRQIEDARRFGFFNEPAAIAFYVKDLISRLGYTVFDCSPEDWQCIINYVFYMSNTEDIKLIGEDRFNKSVSSGTMLNSDLIPKFFDELQAIDYNGATKVLNEYPSFEAILKLKDAAPSMAGDGEEWAKAIYDAYFGLEEADHLMILIAGELDRRAPSPYYFGCSQGNGSDYGFWKTEGVAEDESEISTTIWEPDRQWMNPMGID